MNASITSNLCVYLSGISEKLQNPESKKVRQAETEAMPINYFYALNKISEMVQPLFDKISKCCKKAGFNDAESFAAAPKGRCENFVFLERENTDAKVTHVILAKNTSKGFLQNGGGKTQLGESIDDAAVREAKEEFNFPGTARDMHQITTESESGSPVFHLVKGVHVGFVTPEQAGQLKLGDDMASNEICRMPVEEFLQIAENEKKLIDHGFDRKRIAECIRSGGVACKERTLSDKDVKEAQKAYEWMKNITVDSAKLDGLNDIIQEAVEGMNINGEADGKWKDKKNRDAIREACQKIVDLVMEKLLPKWEYTNDKGEKKVGCQMKVQAAQGYRVDADFLVSFLTVPQHMALKSIIKGVPSALLEAGAKIKIPETLTDTNIKI